MYLLHDPASLDHGRPRLESECPAPFGGAVIALLLRKVTDGRPWIAKWSAWLLGTAIHVSPISGTWLRAHEHDWNKHRADV